MDKFLVHLEPAANNNEVYNIDNIDHCVVHVEQPHQRPRNGVPPQCTKCQRRGHTRNYCWRPAVCVKCAGDHETAKCNLKREEPPKCANCGEGHTANYAGCIDYQRRLTRFRVNQQNRRDYQHQHQQQQPQAHQPAHDQHPHFGQQTYANVVQPQQDTVLKRIEELITKQMETMSTLLDMMTMLMNQICRK